jgi:hypothetical protein
MAPKSRDSRVGYPGVYFIHWNGYIKIGSAGNVRTRLKDIFSNAPDAGLTPLGWIPDDDVRVESRTEREWRIQQTLNQYLVQGEWFLDCQTVRDFIATHARAWPSDDSEIGGPATERSPLALDVGVIEVP